MNNSINLIDYKGKLNTESHVKNQKPLRIIAVGLLFIVSASSIIFFILIAFSPLPTLKRQSEKTAFTLSLSNNDIIKQEIIKKRLGNIKGIIEKRSNFDKLLEYLQNKLPSGVAIDSLFINKGNLSITLASKSLQPIDSFLDALTQEESVTKFSKVSLTSLSNSDNTFLLKLTVNTL